MADKQTADSGTPPINPVADAFEGLKADLTQFLTQPGEQPATAATDGDGATPAADADGDEPKDDLSQDTQASESAAADDAEAAPAEPADDDMADFTPEERRAFGAKVSGRIRKAKAKYAEEAAQAKAALELELSEARAKLQEAEARKTEAVPAQMPVPQDFEAEAKRANDAIKTVDRLIRRLDANPQHVAQQMVELGVVGEVSDPDDPKVQDELLSRLETIKENALSAGRKALEGAQKFQTSYQASSARALALMPELRDPKSERNKLLREVIEQAPWIKSVPNWPEAAVRQVLGIERERELAAAAKAKTGKPAAKPPAVPKPRATMPPGQIAEASMTEQDVAGAIMNENPSARRKLMSHLLRGT